MNSRSTAEVTPSSTVGKRLSEVYKELQKYIDKKGLKSKVMVVYNERGVVITLLTDKMLFESGQSDLLPDELAGRRYYQPTPRGAEAELGRRLEWIRAYREAARRAEAGGAPATPPPGSPAPPAADAPTAP